MYLSVAISDQATLLLRGSWPCSSKNGKLTFHSSFSKIWRRGIQYQNSLIFTYFNFQGERKTTSFINHQGHEIKKKKLFHLSPPLWLLKVVYLEYWEFNQMVIGEFWYGWPLLIFFFFFVKWGLFCEIGPECFEFEISWNFNCCLLSCYFHQLVHLQYLGIFCYLSICYFNFKIISLNLSPVVSLSSLIHVHMSKTPFSFSRTHNLRPWWSAHVFHSRYYSHIEMFGMVFVVYLASDAGILFCCS